MTEITLSVHGLVDFLLRRGSIDNRVYNNSTMAEGSRIHLRYQQIQDGSYLSEQELSVDREVDGFLFHIQGRADGIITGRKIPIIDEIKSTVIPLEEFYEEQKDWHLGQARVYAYMYGKENDIPTLGVRLTYISQKDDEDKLIMNFTYTLEELEEFFVGLLREYLRFYVTIDEHNKYLSSTSGTLEFPYPSYRKGQRELAKYVYGTIVNEETLFVEAPTGIGKTMSTLFPAVKTFATAGTSKIFYLSAKNIAKDVAFDASRKMIEHGLNAKVIKLSSKEKMCQAGSGKCNPDDCPFALGYYDKIRKALTDIIENEELIDDEVIFTYANRYEICAFEFQLDTSLYTDIIICDYNYIFDPLVYLKRYFDFEKTPYVALIDETHNLVDRSKDMYSVAIHLEDFRMLQKEFKKQKHPSFKRALKKTVLFLEGMGSDMENDYLLLDHNFSDELYDLLENYFKQCQDILKNFRDYASDLFVAVFRDVNRFLKVAEFYGDGFCCYYQKEKDNLHAWIRCVDSSRLVRDTLKKLKASVFFSATLTPMDYYVRSLGGNEDTPVVQLESPFPKENLLTLVRTDVSTRYRDREFSYQEIALTIQEAVAHKVGNYLVFFSSYQYLENVYRHFDTFDTEVNYIKQTRDMDDHERVAFLANFREDPEKTTVGFAVLGGAFSEGIDLTNDKLIGAIVVGVGIPQVSFERDLIKAHYDEREENGYDYSYVNPGITKIVQAAGRVIRSENDVGIAIFIDDRYTQSQYQDIFRREFRNSYRCSSRAQMGYCIDEFWKKHSH